MFEFYVIIISVSSKFKCAQDAVRDKVTHPQPETIGDVTVQCVISLGCGEGYFLARESQEWSSSLLTLTWLKCASVVCSLFLWSPMSPANTPLTDISVIREDFSMWGKLSRTVTYVSARWRIPK